MRPEVVGPQLFKCPEKSRQITWRKLSFYYTNQPVCHSKHGVIISALCATKVIIKFQNGRIAQKIEGSTKPEISNNSGNATEEHQKF